MILKNKIDQQVGIIFYFYSPKQEKNFLKMAALQTIRNKAGILISVIIGLALLAFILDPKTIEAITSSGRTNIGKVKGKKISYTDFQKQVEDMTAQIKQSSQTVNSAMMGNIRDQSWNNIVAKTILTENINELGLDVGGAEIMDMLTGEHINPAIKQEFRNKETGLFDRDLVVRYLKYIEKNPKEKQNWIPFETRLTEERINYKFIQLISKTNYTTTLEVENRISESETMADFQYIYKPYSSVSVDKVKLTDLDYKKYYKEHKNLFEQKEEKRDILYVAFPIVASAEDKAEIESEVAKIKEEFAISTDDIYFSKMNSDEPSDNNYLSKEDIDKDFASLYDAKEGTLIGPLKIDSEYKMAKLFETKMVSDSFQLKHLFLGFKTADGSDKEAIMKKVDSLKKAVSKGADFTTLVMKYSDDPEKTKKAGDIGWIKLKQSNPSLIDSCLKVKEGQTFLNLQQQGIGIIQVAKKSTPNKKVKIAKVIKKIDPTDKTVNSIYTKASKFIAENNNINKFKKAIINDTLVQRVSAFNLQNMAFTVNNLQEARVLVRSVFNAKKSGDILTTQEGTAVFECEGYYVVGFLTTIKEKGYMPLVQIKDEISPKVRKQKTAEIIIKELETKVDLKKEDLASIATKTGLQIKEILSVPVAQEFINEIGYEPKVSGALINSELNKTSLPIIGENGVVILKVKSKTQPDLNPQKIAMFKGDNENINNKFYEILESLINNEKTRGNYKDNRFNFY